jgi:hypothetical protein
MSQPDSEQIVNAAADAIAGGTALDGPALYAAAGHAVLLADAENNHDFLKLVALVKAGKYVQANALLMELAIGAGSGSNANANPLANLLSGATPSAPAAPAAPAAPTTSRVRRNR